VLRLALKFFPEFGILGGNAHRAGVEVALPHHRAAHHNQGDSCKAYFICPKHCGNGYVKTCAHLTICLDNDT